MVHGLRSPQRRKIKEEPRSSRNLKMVGKVIRQGAPIKPPPQIHQRVKNAAVYVLIQARYCRLTTSPVAFKIQQIVIPWANDYSRGEATSDDNGEPPADTDEIEKEKGGDKSSDNEDKEERRQEKGAALRQKCHMPPLNAEALPVGRKTPPLLATKNYLLRKNCRVFTVNNIRYIFQCCQARQHHSPPFRK